MEGPTIAIKQGTLRGKCIKSPSGKTINCFLGIPFAEPPVGDLRFKPPVPAKGWQGVRDATKEGNQCMQVQILTRKVAGNEDCLFLNVMTPDIDYKTANAKKIPVMVYVHGGGFINGSGNLDLFSPDFLVEEDIILVNINYRLGIFGFLCMDIQDAAGNMAMKDQNLAFKWVKENIATFGGDPDNVTLCGHSAGAVSVDYHVLSPMSKGLFNRVIIQSGSVLIPWAKSRNPIKMAQRLVEKLGGKYENPESALEFLKNQSAEKLAEVAFYLRNKADLKMADYFSFVPVVEKIFPGQEAFLAEDPLVLLREGRITHVPTLMGFCDKEGILFKHMFYLSELSRLKQQRFIDYVPPYFYDDEKDYDDMDEKLRSLYKRNFEDKDPDEYVNNFLSDMLFIGPISKTLEYKLKHTKHENFYYQFCYDGKFNFVKLTMNLKDHGACHGDDLAYLSKSYYLSEDSAQPSDLTVRRRLVYMWTNYVKNGNPTPEKNDLVKQVWKPNVSGDEKLGYMNIAADMRMKSDPYPERLQFWKKLHESL